MLLAHLLQNNTRCHELWVKKCLKEFKDNNKIINCKSLLMYFFLSLFMINLYIISVTVLLYSYPNEIFLSMVSEVDIISSFEDNHPRQKISVKNNKEQ